MKFSVQKSVLMEKLIPAMGTVSNKNTITSIEGVLIETIDGETVRLSTYDMNKGVRATFTPSEIEREGRFIINAQRFYQTVKVLPEQEITIDINDKLNCTISSGKASFSMFAMDADEFPVLPELSTDNGFEISGAVLRKMISKVSHSIAEQDIRPMLRGAFFKFEENKLEVVSCDSYTLSKCEITCDIEYFGHSDHKHSLIIPGHALAEMMKILGDSEEKADLRLDFAELAAGFAQEGRIVPGVDVLEPPGRDVDEATEGGDERRVVVFGEVAVRLRDDLRERKAGEREILD